MTKPNWSLPKGTLEIHPTFSLMRHANGVGVNVLRKLTLDRWKLALQRMRALIAGGERYYEDDSDEIGNKHTEFSWGMCSVDPRVWPEAEDHIWPTSFEKENRSAPLDRPRAHHCPMDRLPEGETSDSGCFYTCRVFQRHGKEPRLSRADAIALYDAKLATLTKGDD